MVVNIDCVAFKRDCGSEPQAIAARESLYKHQNACSDCADFYQGMLALDAQLQAAFSFPVAKNALDEQLSKVQQTQEKVVRLHSKRSQNEKSGAVQSQAGQSQIATSTRPKYTWFAAAASMVLAAFLVGTLRSNTALIADEVIEHIHHEPDLLLLTESITSDEKIQMVLKQSNISLAPGKLEILAAKLCPVGEQLAAHLIVKGEYGPVTILIMPGNETKAGAIKSKEFNGRILTAEHGVMAVVGGKRENLEQLESSFTNAFQWLD